MSDPGEGIRERERERGGTRHLLLADSRKWYIMKCRRREQPGPCSHIPNLLRACWVLRFRIQYIFVFYIVHFCVVHCTCDVRLTLDDCMTGFRDATTGHYISVDRSVKIRVKAINFLMSALFMQDILR